VLVTRAFVEDFEGTVWLVCIGVEKEVDDP
jgi:hypothetical protein